MHLFDADDLRHTQSSFFISIVLVSLVTWVFAGIGLWVAGSPETQKKLNGAASTLWKRTAKPRTAGRTTPAEAAGGAEEKIGRDEADPEPRLGG